MIDDESTSQKRSFGRAAVIRGFSALTLGTVLLLAGCAVRPTSEPGSPEESSSAAAPVAVSLDQLFSRALASGNLTRVEEQVIDRAISKGQIAEWDYERAHKRYANCMAARGYRLAFRKSFYGVYIELPYAAGDPRGVFDQSAAACSFNNAVVRSLYRTQQGNPGLLGDQNAIAVACLVSKGQVPSDYTAAQFRSDRGSGELPFDPFSDTPSDCLYAAGWAYLTAR